MRPFLGLACILVAMHIIAEYPKFSLNSEMLLGSWGIPAAIIFTVLAAIFWLVLAGYTLFKKGPIE